MRTLRGRLLVVATVRTDDPDRAADRRGRSRRPTWQGWHGARLDLLPLGRLTADEVRDPAAPLCVGSPPATRCRSADRAAERRRAVRGRGARSGRGRPAARDRVGGRRGPAGRVVGRGPTPGRRGRCRRGTPADQSARAGLDATPDELDAALVEAVRAGRGDHDTDGDAVRLPPCAAPRGRRAGARSRAPGDRGTAGGQRSSRPSPGVLAADPAALAIAEHWHQARDVRRALAATVAALPAAGANLPPGRGGCSVDPDLARIPAPGGREPGRRHSRCARPGPRDTRLSGTPSYWSAASSSHPCRRAADSPAEARWSRVMEESEHGKGEIKRLFAGGLWSRLADAFEHCPRRPG